MPVTEIHIPQLGVNDQEATIVEWYVQHLTRVESGTAVCCVETTKAVYDVYAPATGCVARLAATGDTVSMASPIGFVGPDQDSLTRAVRQHTPAKQQPVVSEPARQLANKLGVDVAVVPHNGVLGTEAVQQYHDQQNQHVAEPMQFDKSKFAVVIYGAGNGGLVAMRCFKLMEEFEAVCFVDDVAKQDRNRTKLPVYHPGKLEQLYNLGVDHLFVAVTNVKTRVALYQCYPNFVIAAPIHPTAYLDDDATVGPGTHVKAGAVVDYGAYIAPYCIVDNNVTVAHHSKVGMGTHLAPGVTLGGNVVVGQQTVIGVGSNVVSGVRIGDNVVVGAGSLVDHDLPDNVVVRGAPATPVRAGP